MAVRPDMQRSAGRLGPGLYVVSSPIGAARDITLRALDVLTGADLIVAEDTRRTRALLALHGIALEGRRILSYNDHNAPRARPAILAALEQGQAVALLSDAGTPLVADPGFKLVEEAIARGVEVIPVPGPSAVLAALTKSGLPSDRFLFAGFPPPARGARRRCLEELAVVPATLVLFESPRRVAGLLRDLAAVFGPTRRAALCRELTKLHEECLRGTLAELAERLAERPVKGEIVLVVDRAPMVRAGAEDVDAVLASMGEGSSVRDAATELARRTGMRRREAYEAVLAQRRGRREPPEEAGEEG